MKLEHVGKLLGIVNVRLHFNPLIFWCLKFSKCYFWFQNFEDFVAEHFLTRARDILRACKAYMDGSHVEVWLLVTLTKVAEYFKNSLHVVMDALVEEFAKIGVWS